MLLDVPLDFTSPCVVFFTVQDPQPGSADRIRSIVRSDPRFSSQNAPAWVKKVFDEALSFCDSMPTERYAVVSTRLPNQRLPRGAVVLGIVDEDLVYRSVGSHITDADSDNLKVYTCDPSVFSMFLEFDEATSAEMIAEFSQQLADAAGSHLTLGTVVRNSLVRALCMGLVQEADTVKFSFAGHGSFVFKSRSGDITSTGIFA